MGCCGVMNYQAIALAAKNINMATTRLTPPKTTDASLDAARMTCTGQVILPELEGVSSGLLQPSVHAKANQSYRFLRGSLFAHPFL